MGLTASAPRAPLHQRDVVICGYRREDGFWDIEGHLTDRRSHALQFPDGERLAGADIHSMWLRLTIDASAMIVAVEADTEASPYEGVCGVITSVYSKLVGLRIGPGFRAELRRLFAGVRGCTHMSELVGAMATAALQTLVGESPADPDQQPRQLNGCHALDTSGVLVAQYFPKWYRQVTGP